MLSLSDKISIALCAIRVNQFIENFNDCHGEDGRFCEGGGSGSGAGGSYTPMRVQPGHVSAGTFPAHQTLDQTKKETAEANLKAIEAIAAQHKAEMEKLIGKTEPSKPAISGEMEKHPNWKEAIKEHTYTETKKGQYGQYENKVEPKVWRKGSKERVYVPRNAFEQAGYVTKDKNDVSGRNSGSEGDWYYSATRPGNTGDLISFAKSLSKHGIK